MCGTPASGKTVLLSLLYERILKDIPDAQVFVIEEWPRQEFSGLPLFKRFQIAIGRSQFKTSHFSGIKMSEKHFYLFDDAQATYWDVELVNRLKNDFQPPIGPRPHAILFYSHGDGTLGSQMYSPFSFGGGTIGLNRVAGLGLSLDEDEFRDVIRRFEEKVLLDDDLTTCMYHLTSGHVGALRAVLRYFMKTVRNSDFLIQRLPYQSFCRRGSFCRRAEPIL